MAAAPTHPWPVDRPPRPEDWVDWFLSLDYPAQYDVAETVLAAHATATRCTQHHGRPASSQPCRPRPEEIP